MTSSGLEGMWTSICLPIRSSQTSYRPNRIHARLPPLVDHRDVPIATATPCTRKHNNIADRHYRRNHIHQAHNIVWFLLGLQSSYRPIVFIDYHDSDVDEIVLCTLFRGKALVATKDTFTVLGDYSSSVLVLFVCVVFNHWLVLLVVASSELFDLLVFGGLCF